MKKIGILLCLVMQITLSWAQAPYAQQVKMADSLYKAKDYKDAAIAYETAFKKSKETEDIYNRYNAACTWALAGYADNSFKNLDLIIGKTYFDYENRYSVLA